MPTLARLSFWVSPERMDTFETTYKKKIVPILNKHDLVESSEPGRPTVKGVFSRLFEVEQPSEVAVKETALRSDPVWQEMLRHVGTAFGVTQPDGFMRTRFGICTASAGSGRTVQAGSGIQQGVWHTLDISDGLPGSSVVAIFQDREGVLWFGTWEGVSRYDGERFTTFTTADGLADNTVLAICQDRSGYLWFGTVDGVCRYEAHPSDGGQFTTFTTEDGLPGNLVKVILEDRGGLLWFGTGFPERMLPGGVTRYDAHPSDGEQFTTFTTADGLGANAVWSILEDREGVLWFGTRGGGVSRYEAHRSAGEQFTTFTTEDGLAHNKVDSIIEDQAGHLWFGTCGGGVSRYDPSVSSGGTGEAFTTFTTADGLAGNLVFVVIEDRKGVLWIGTNGGGVSRYDARCTIGEQFTTFAAEDGLADNSVSAIFEDREGNLWFGTGWAAGTLGGGVCRYAGEQVTTFTTRDGLPGRGVMCIAEDRKGTLWLGTWSGVCRYEKGRFTTLEGLVANVWAIVEDREENLWFGTYGGGVQRYDGEGFTTFTAEDGLAHNTVSAILEDREGVLWFGTGGGVSRYDPSASFRRSWGAVHDLHNRGWSAKQLGEGYF